MKNETTPMILSSEAQAVLDAANNASSYGPDDCLNDALYIAVAVLRAVADVNVGTDYQNGKRVATILRSDILAIADELVN